MTRARPLAPEQRRRHIIAATTPLVLEHGSAISTRQIAEACGLAEGTLFRAFENKAAIISAVCHQIFDPAELIAELDGIDRDLPLPQRIARTVTLAREASERVRALLMVFHSGRMCHEPRDRHRDQDTTRQRQLDITQAITRVLEPDADQLRVPVTTAAHFLLMSVQITAMPYPGTVPPQNDTLITLLSHGICRSREDSHV